SSRPYSSGCKAARAPSGKRSWILSPSSIRALPTACRPSRSARRNCAKSRKCSSSTAMPRLPDMRQSIANAQRRNTGHHGGGATHDYFASMTDMMLGLVFVFIVILMVIVGDLRRPQPAEIASVQPEPKVVSELTEVNLARRDLLRDIAKILNG